jgi:hypothetical protein
MDSMAPPILTNGSRYACVWAITELPPREDTNQGSHRRVCHPKDIMLDCVAAQAGFPYKAIQNDSGSYVVEPVHNDGA